MSAIDDTREALDLMTERLKLARERNEPITRDHVAGLAFDLMACIDRLVQVCPLLAEEPDNGPVFGMGPTVGLVTTHEELSAGRDRRLVVARFATRWYLLEGFTVAPLSTYDVHGPFDRHEHAMCEAMALHERRTQKAREMVQAVGE